MISATISAISGSSFGAFFARAYQEVEAFFEEALIAVQRANKEEPFGL
ncbi:hypothetical protein IHQ68_18725 [Chelatococcus sambhunathii]|uniref:Uncharacterized protein n=1 Tax=Chelatococcus sambhunathii TaxID=363953 RepID=A0ABU1DLA3_9HYPH|nr:hypothetical protein [Chelatococcus sambhunathii]MDR4308660.1 hypothetical protein [Chelatococcus sambhunathii]